MDYKSVYKSWLLNRFKLAICKVLSESGIDEGHLRFNDYLFVLNKLIIRIAEDQNHSLMKGPMDDHLPYITTQLRNKLIALKAEEGNEVNRLTAERIINKYLQSELLPISNGYYILSWQ